MRRSAALCAAALVLLTTSCKQKTSSDAKVPITPPADSSHQQMTAARTPVQLQLDSGNIAYRARDYAGARAHYMQATRMDSTAAAAWFGVYMAEDRLGNKAQAEYAMKRASALNPTFGQPDPHAQPQQKKESKT